MKTAYRWTQELADQLKAETRPRVHHLRDSMEPKGFLAEMLKLIHETSKSPDPADRLQCLIYIISTFINCRQSSLITDKTAKRLEKLANTLLRLHRVTPHVSALGGLYGELYSAVGRYYRNVGAHRTAIWYQGLANRIAKSFQSKTLDYHLLISGNRWQRIGMMPDAAACFSEVVAKYPSSSHRTSVMIQLARQARWAGDAESFEKWTGAVAASTSDDPLTTAILAWEKQCRGVQKGETVGNLRAFAVTVDRAFRADFILDGVLWALGSNVAKEVDAWRKIVDDHKEDFHRVEDDRVVKVIRTLLKYYASPLKGTSIEDRIHSIGMLLPLADSALTVERELLCLLALARWLHRNKDQELKAVVMARYRQLSTHVTQGLADDALGIGAGMERPE